jgi:hypothetical protein
MAISSPKFHIILETQPPLWCRIRVEVGAGRERGGQGGEGERRAGRGGEGERRAGNGERRAGRGGREERREERERGGQGG